MAQKSFLPVDTSLEPLNEVKGYQAISNSLVLEIKARKDKTAKWLTINIQTPTQMQDGPNCGLVALNIAGQYYLKRVTQKMKDDDVEKIFALAKSLGYTEKGEMFSAANLAQLAQDYFHLKTDLEHSFNANKLLQHLLCGHLCLIPYDKDKDHSPCCLQGEKAHWGLVVGIVIPVFEDSGKEAFYSNSQPENLYIDDGWETLLYRLNGQDGFELTVEKINVTQQELAQAFVIALHGKSRHQALWSLEALIKSNNNLEKASEKLKEGPLDLSGLKNKAVYLIPN